MASIVVDASAALAWGFRDEASAWSQGVLARVRAGDRVLVPAHWHVEIVNAVVMSCRRGRISASEAQTFFALIEVLDPQTLPLAPDRIFHLAEKHGLTAYDAAYLDIAVQLGLELATKDGDLQIAARAEGVPLL